MNTSIQDKFYELSYYTLAHPDTVYFIHQHIVDAYQAQSANENTKPIALTFALVGLYLYLEKSYTGKQVQQAHVTMSQNKKPWPKIELPLQRGTITVLNVLTAEPGQERDMMIKEWCASVWQAYKASHSTISALVKAELGI
jgi:Family of unknown function (DUF5946)